MEYGKWYPCKVDGKQIIFPDCVTVTDGEELEIRSQWNFHTEQLISADVRKVRKPNEQG